ncbi:MAG: hypothetical protein HQ557_18710 [Bacteroidetes bacterium]|nr:hypothetical protein [Bacteroidota bacterium]
MITQDLEREVLQKFRKRKVMTIAQLHTLLSCSIPTVRKRLMLWGSYTSYNCNGRYYTLSGIPQFDEHGLWEYRGIRFSRFGTLKQTTIHLISESAEGLTATEIGELVGLNPRSFMVHFKELPQLHREKVQGRYVYSSADPAVGERQRSRREAAVKKQALMSLSDHDAMLVFADFIRNPETSFGNRVQQLRRQGLSVDEQSITALLNMHGITEKKTPEQHM